MKVYALLNQVYTLFQKCITCIHFHKSVHTFIKSVYTLCQKCIHFWPKVYTLLAQSVYTFDKNVCILAGNVCAILPKMYAFLHTHTIHTCVRNVHINNVYIYINIDMCVAKKLCQELCV